MNEDVTDETLDPEGAIDLLKPLLPGEIHAFWFGELGLQDPFVGGMATAGTRERWFRGDESFDREIRDRFLGAWRALRVLGGAGLPQSESERHPLLRSASRGSEDSEGTGLAAAALARIVVLDQFPRNLFRGSAGMFSTDADAVRETLQGIDSGIVSELRGDAKAFFFMPLMHSEDQDLQRLSVEKFCGLGSDGDEQFRLEFRELAENYAQFARDHQVIVERFGRFPHRNALLGRDSTKEELTFLKGPGSSF